jgi:hypothetical protein
MIIELYFYTQNTSIIFPGIPLVLIYCLQLMIANRSDENIYENYTCLYILAFGFVWSKTTIRLIVRNGEIFREFNSYSINYLINRLHI